MEYRKIDLETFPRKAHFEYFKTLANPYAGGTVEVDITDFLRPDKNELVVRVLDHSNRTEQSRGKQSLERGGIFYTAQSGIWQPVWLEQVPSSYLKEVWFETDYDKRLVTAHVTALTTKTLPPFSLTFSYQNKLIASQSLKAELPSPSLGSSQNAGPEPEKAYRPGQRP